MPRGRFRVGIDEAGYGPTLGPLVVGVVRVRGRSLAAALAAGGDALPRIADSKALYRGGAGFAALETTALAAVSCARGVVPATLAAFLAEAPRGLDDHPWYADLHLPLPLVAPVARVASAARALASALKTGRVHLDVAAATPVLEGTFNRRLVAAENKAALEMEVIAELLHRHRPPAEAGRVSCDRLGGRRFYGDWLRSLFPGDAVRVIEEHREASRYAVGSGRAAVDYEFLVGGDARVAEIALASCIAKYAREAMMHLFNRFWTGRKAGVRPTAGYPTDARRFLGDLSGDTVLEAHRAVLVRQR